MTTIDPSTAELDVDISTVDPSTEEEPRRGVWPPPHIQTYYLRLGPNELASTERAWAAKPPPGMESEPLTPETIKRDLGSYGGSSS